jgi:hypothetical protein
MTYSEAEGFGASTASGSPFRIFKLISGAQMTEYDICCNVNQTGGTMKAARQALPRVCL